MTSSHHAPYALGDTRATIAGTKGRDPARNGPSTPGKRIEEASDYFMHVPLARGDIAQLVELRTCNWVLAITSWMSNCPGEEIELIKVTSREIRFAFIGFGRSAVQGSFAGNAER
ncbi:hypothetical protein T459_02427 [Capsicum annuum]|uniref:Uncharacterized protein n=1 Tax=Capsicum annuum TaxID=4072 RepID=A0A2G3AJX7_CAPAN|nr:hypothetical protein T459_02427 [Capsicum annuum]